MNTPLNYLVKKELLQCRTTGSNSQCGKNRKKWREMIGKRLVFFNIISIVRKLPTFRFEKQLTAGAGHGIIFFHQEEESQRDNKPFPLVQWLRFSNEQRPFLA
jgi:hypothetical protein